MLTALTIAVVVVIGVLIAAALRPSDFRVERTAVIKAPPEKIYPLINNMHQFNTWNPFVKMDPAIKGSYSGAESGRGAAYAWESSKVGTGRMEIVDTQAPRKVIMSLQFVKPFAGDNTAEFTLDPQSDATAVTWAMYGKSAYIPKLMGLFFSQDKMIGGSFESGLANLKASAEAL
jgi:uncharacterized protein YndB with AHSA1/START domain